MKNLNLITLVLLMIGGLNWGLVGSINFDLVEMLFGNSILASIVYILVGVSAVYQIAQWKSIQKKVQTDS